MSEKLSTFKLFKNQAIFYDRLLIPYKAICFTILALKVTTGVSLQFIIYTCSTTDIVKKRKDLANRNFNRLAKGRRLLELLKEECIQVYA